MFKKTIHSLPIVLMCAIHVGASAFTIRNHKVPSERFANIGWEDVSYDYVDEFYRCFSGKKVGKGDTVIKKSTGKETIAHGTARITDLKEASGFIWMLKGGFLDPVSENTETLYRSSPMSVKFNFTAKTTARKKALGVNVDWPWKNHTVGGNMESRLYVNPGNAYTLQVKFHINPGHDDRPNNFIADYVAPKFKPLAKSCMADALMVPESKVKIIN